MAKKDQSLLTQIERATGEAGARSAAARALRRDWSKLDSYEGFAEIYSGLARAMELIGHDRENRMALEGMLKVLKRLDESHTRWLEKDYFAEVREVMPKILKLMRNDVPPARLHEYERLWGDILRYKGGSK